MSKLSKGNVGLALLMILVKKRSSKEKMKEYFSLISHLSNAKNHKTYIKLEDKFLNLRAAVLKISKNTKIPRPKTKPRSGFVNDLGKLKNKEAANFLEQEFKALKNGQRGGQRGGMTRENVAWWLTIFLLGSCGVGSGGFVFLYLYYSPMSHFNLLTSAKKRMEKNIDGCNSFKEVVERHVLHRQLSAAQRKAVGPTCSVALANLEDGLEELDTEWENIKQWVIQSFATGTLAFSVIWARVYAFSMRICNRLEYGDTSTGL
jgi:hypothetical protein